MARVKTCHDYDPFAWLYAHYWGADYHRQILPTLDRLLLRHLPAQATILDLCCGDGRLASQLAARDYRVTGVDGSPGMLKFARRNAPSVRFVIGDARRLSLRGKFQAVVSTFDSLNHVQEITELGAVFRGVHKLLASEGRFAFDLNREEAYLELWPQTYPMVRPEVVTINQSDYDPERGLATCGITQFRNTGKAWKRTDFTLTQRHHPHEAVLSALQQAGFGQIATFDAAEDLAMTGQLGRYRTFYLASKQGA